MDRAVELTVEALSEDYIWDTPSEIRLPRLFAEWPVAGDTIVQQLPRSLQSAVLGLCSLLSPILDEGALI